MSAGIGQVQTKFGPSCPRSAEVGQPMCGNRSHDYAVSNVRKHSERAQNACPEDNGEHFGLQCSIPSSPPPLWEQKAHDSAFGGCDLTVLRCICPPEDLHTKVRSLLKRREQQGLNLGLSVR